MAEKAEIRATITITAPSADSDEATISVDFDPPMVREQPTVVARCAAVALEALLTEAANSSRLELVDAPAEVKRAAG